MQLSRVIFRLLLALACMSPVESALAQEQFYRPKNQDLFKMAEELKERGIYEHHWVVVPGALGFDGFDGLQGACDAVVVATLLDSRARPSGSRMSIETVHRFRIEELVSGNLRGPAGRPAPQPRPKRSGVPGAPGFDLPAKDEILVWTQGGILRINEVFLREHGGLTLRIDRQYILFLKRTDPQFGTYYGNQLYDMMFPVFGPYGCIEIREDGIVQSQIPSLNEHLEEHFFSSKDELLRYLRTPSSNLRQGPSR